MITEAPAKKGRAFNKGWGMVANMYAGMVKNEILNGLSVVENRRQEWWRLRNGEKPISKVEADYIESVFAKYNVKNQIWD